MASGISLKEFFDTETDGAFGEDPLLKQIFHLTPAQRKALVAFLETITTK